MMSWTAVFRFMLLPALPRLKRGTGTTASPVGASQRLVAHFPNLLSLQLKKNELLTCASRSSKHQSNCHQWFGDRQSPGISANKISLVLIPFNIGPNFKQFTPKLSKQSLFGVGILGGIHLPSLKLTWHLKTGKGPQMEFHPTQSLIFRCYCWWKKSG